MNTIQEKSEKSAEYFFEHMAEFISEEYGFDKEDFEWEDVDKENKEGLIKAFEYLFSKDVDKLESV